MTDPKHAPGGAGVVRGVVFDDRGIAYVPRPAFMWIEEDGSLTLEWVHGPKEAPRLMLVVGDPKDGSYLIETSAEEQWCSLDDGSNPFMELAKRILTPKPTNPEQD